MLCCGLYYLPGPAAGAHPGGAPRGGLGPRPLPRLCGEAQPLPDLVTKCITKDGQVEPISIHGHTEGDVDAVSVGGDTAYAPGRWVPADTQVVIHYHALPEQGMAATPKK